MLASGEAQQQYMIGNLPESVLSLSAKTVHMTQFAGGMAQHQAAIWDRSLAFELYLHQPERLPHLTPNKARLASMLNRLQLDSANHQQHQLIWIASEASRIPKGIQFYSPPQYVKLLLLTAISPHHHRPLGRKPPATLVNAI
jgi:hypothetical protein